MPAEDVVDAHHHVWGPAQAALPWVAGHESLSRTWGLADLEPHLAAGGITATVLVQAANEIAETDELLTAAQEHPRVAGVVGWVPLADAAAAIDLLDRWGELPLVGVRHLPDDSDEDAWLARATHAQVLQLLAVRGLVLDIAARTRGHLAAVCTVADENPDLVVVLDHLGKPPLDDPEQLADWRRDLSEVAKRPRVVAKLSGLSTCTGPGWTYDDLRPAVEHALATFGVDRCCWGSDWPVSLLRGSYAEELNAMQHLLSGASRDERGAVLSATARRTYRLCS